MIGIIGAWSKPQRTKTSGFGTGIACRDAHTRDRQWLGAIPHHY
jgi:hypothetical protein